MNLRVASNTLDGVLLEWDPESFATHFNVNRAQGAATFAFLDATADLFYLDTTAVPGQAYRYEVHGITGAGQELAACGEVRVVAIPFFPGAFGVAFAAAGAVAALVLARRR